MFNQRSTTTITSKGELEFIEEMFDVNTRIKESKEFNVVQVNAGNGEGCNELYQWI